MLGTQSAAYYRYAPSAALAGLVGLNTFSLMMSTSTVALLSDILLPDNAHMLCRSSDRRDSSFPSTN